MLQENQFYNSQINNRGDATLLQPGIQPKTEIISLTKSRAALVTENQLYRGQLGDPKAINSLKREQLERLQSSQAELQSREAASRLVVAQLKAQLSQADIQLANFKSNSNVDRGILHDLVFLAEAGAISKIQFLKQQQQVQTNLAEVEKSIQEQARLKLAIREAEYLLLIAILDLSKQEWM